MHSSSLGIPHSLVGGCLVEFLRHFKSYFPKFMRHHQQCKLQDDDIAHIKRHLLNGEVFSVQDFSENYHIKPKIEHQQRCVASACDVVAVGCWW